MLACEASYATIPLMARMVLHTAYLLAVGRDSGGRAIDLRRVILWTAQGSCTE